MNRLKIKDLNQTNSNVAIKGLQVYDPSGVGSYTIEGKTMAKNAQGKWVFRYQLKGLGLTEDKLVSEEEIREYETEIEG